MSDVHANPEEMRAFATHLVQFSQEVEHLHATTVSRMSQLNESWRDQENAEFVARYHQVVQPLIPLIEALQEYSLFLHRKSAALDEFLNMKL